MAERSENKMEKIVRGEAALWVQAVAFVAKAMFFVFDLVTYLPYQVMEKPKEKLEYAQRTKARFEGDRESPIQNYAGLITEDFEGKNTVDKLWRHVSTLHGDKPALGTRELLKVHEERQENGKIFEKWELGEYSWLSYKEVEETVAGVAAGLKTFAVGPDAKVVIYAETRAHWLMTALSCFRANIPMVTVYATLGEDAIAAAIAETESTIIVTSSEQLEKIGSLGKRCPGLKTLIYMPPVNKDKHPDLRKFRDQFENLLSFSELENRSKIHLTESSANPDETALIMYTSGTTGAPKGVMITHRNIVAAICGQGRGCAYILTEKDVYIGYLPLAHIMELIVELTCLTRSCRVGYSSPNTLHDRATKIQKGTHGDCFVLRPTMMAAVPAIMDRIFKAVSEEVAASPRIMQEIFKLHFERKKGHYLNGFAGLFLDSWVIRVVFKKVRGLFGGRLAGIVAGGAPLNPDTQMFMSLCLCCPIAQGYGLTETSGAACVQEPCDVNTGTVGAVVCCSELLLREWGDGGYSPRQSPPKGEILVGGANIAQGYWKQPEKTAEDFVEIKGKRYFCTGDIGEMRPDGSIIIIDRKKDLVKLAHGEYVALAKVECALANCPLIDNICVYGNSHEAFCIALIVPNQKHLEKVATEIGEETKDMPTMCSNDNIIAAFLKKLDEHAKKGKLSKTEMPLAIYLCPEPWTPDSGLLTEALKLKRKPIQKKFQSIIDDLYKKNRIAA